jgi:gliding motility-associated-like protein
VNGPAAVCSGESAVFAALASGGSGSYAYQWSNGTTNDSLFLNNPVSGTYFLVVTDLVASCSDTVFFNLTVNPNPLVSVSGQTQLCSGDPALLQLNNAIPSANDLYVWSTGTIGNTLNITNPSGGNYFGYVVNNLTGCSDTAFFTLSVSPTPSISYTGSTSLCSGQPLLLNASSSSAGINFTWSSGASGPLLSIPNPSTGLIILTGTDPLSGCIAQVNISVQVISTPQPVFVNPQLQICSGASELYVVQVNGGSGSFSFLWSTGQVGNPVTISNFPGGALQCTVTDLNTGCSGTASVNLTLTPSPQVFFLQQPSGGCPGEPAVFEAGVAGGSGSYDFQWSTGDTTALITWNNPVSGQIQCVISDQNTGCSSLLTTTLTLFPAPQMAFDQTTNQVCEGNAAFFSVNTTGGSGNYTYAWSTGQSGAFVSITPSQSDTLQVVVTDQSSGCTDTASTYILVFPSPVAQFSAATPVCEGYPVALQNTSSNASTYLWNFGNGAGSNVENPNYQYPGPGNFQITLIASNGGCSDTISQPVEIGGFPEIELGEPRVEDWDAYLPLLINNPGFTTVDWGDGTVEQDPPRGRLSHGYTATGTYTIVVSSYQPPGCFDSDTITVEIMEPLRLFTPSSFTPNGDELNDLFQVVNNLKPGEFYQLRIFNRWGQQFFMSGDPGQSWDGTYRGADAPEGVYLFELSYNSERAKKKGLQIVTGQIHLYR